MNPDNAIAKSLKLISTATATTILFKHGLRNIWIRGAKPLGNKSGRVAGKAFTLRFIPSREDLSTPQAWSSPKSSRKAVEQVPENSIVVVDAMGYSDAGVFGDILCARLVCRGAAGVVTDGAMRDIVGVASTNLPIWASSVAAPPAVCGLTFVGWQDPIACGGVAIFPDDWILADEDGAIVIPAAYITALLDTALEQEALEEWILTEIKRGHSLDGMYPPDDRTLERYRKYCEGKNVR
ncbi:ribonuclease activity regulator RraA [Advenella kashmirensis]